MFTKRPVTVWLLAFVLVLLAVGGAAGAWMFLTHPDGVGIGMEATLHQLPASSFAVIGGGDSRARRSDQRIEQTIERINPDAVRRQR